MSKCDSQIDLDVWNKLIKETEQQLKPLTDIKKTRDRNTDPRDQSDDIWPNPSIKKLNEILDNLKKQRALAEDRAERCPCNNQ